MRLRANAATLQRSFVIFTAREQKNVKKKILSCQSKIYFELLTTNQNACSYPTFKKFDPAKPGRIPLHILNLCIRQ